MLPSDEWEPSPTVLAAAAHSLALLWPARIPSMCGLGLAPEEMRAVRNAAREVLIAAERMKNDDASHD